ncbi:MAG: PQQ-dependent sugar dehydrogenase [Pseudomonadota bacterium]
MLSAFFHKLGLYLSFTLCQVTNFGCAYGAESVEPPSNLQLKLPSGFHINIFAKLAENYGQPRMLAVDKQGRLYAALASTNQVVMLPDSNKDGVAETPIVIANNLNSPNSLVLIDDMMLIANQDGVVKLTKSAEKWSKPQPFISNLAFGHHTQKTIKFGPDNHLYINIGSSCNVCVESDPMRATIQRYTLEGKPAGSLVTLGRHAADPTWAKGLRNSQGFAWHPKTGAMFATNNGSDMRSGIKNGKVNDELPPEHLNKIEPGKHYGWPYCWANTDDLKATESKAMVQDPNFVGEANFCQSTTPPAITFISHSTPIGITFLDKTNWPAEYKNDAIVALHGSWNRQKPSGYKLVRVKFNGDKPTEVTDFATGWLNAEQEKGNPNVWGRPIDAIVGADGALYVSDDRAGYIYRITHKPN